MKDIHEMTDPKSVKTKIIKKKLQEHKCALCNLLPEWNGQLLVLQLDHIDGNNKNNQLNNLRLLCPNCHSQTSTYTGRNINRGEPRRQVKHCQCGKSILKESNTCRACRLHASKIDWPSYEELLKLVNESNFSSVSRMLGVSDNAVRKRLLRDAPK